MHFFSLTYWIEFPQRGFLNYADGEPKARIFNISISIISLMGLLISFYNFILIPGRLAFTGPLFFLIALTVDKYRYHIKLEHAALLFVLIISLTAAIRMYQGIDFITWLKLFIGAIWIISTVFSWPFIIAFCSGFCGLLLFNQAVLDIEVSIHTYIKLVIFLTTLAFVLNYYIELLLIARDKEQSQIQELKRFLASISHELRSPLQSIIGSQDIIKEKVVPEHAAYLYSAQKQSKHLLRMINDILNLTKVEQTKIDLSLQPTDLVLLLESEYRETQAAINNKAITVELFIDDTIPNLVNTDSDRLHQVIQNLCSNAVKYTDSGTIKISALHKLTSAGMHDVTFIVNDTGRGMTAEQLTKLGTQFYQTNYQNPGSGLGIYIVNRILDVFGSELHIQSSLGAGTTFSFTISFTAIKESHEPMMFEYAPDLLKSDAEKVLVVDDNAINIEILTAQLQMGGFSVTSCISGKECVDFCKKSDEFDVILMDVMMPGMDGLETTRVLRNMNISKPIIAISAANEQFTDRFTEKVNGLQLIQESLNKPFNASQINQVIHAVCKSQN